MDLKTYSHVVFIFLICACVVLYIRYRFLKKEFNESMLKLDIMLNEWKSKKYKEQIC